MRSSYYTEKLLPRFTEKEKQELLVFQNVYEKYAESFTKKTVEDLKTHPEFGKIISDIPTTVMAEMNRRSRKLQKDAIVNDNWQPFIEYQLEQGVNYAKMGLNFRSWYEVVALLRSYLSPYISSEYKNSNDFLNAMNGMNTFLDNAMSFIGEAYVKEKEGIIKDEQDKVNELNLQLEQKVKIRTIQLEEAINELEAFTYSVSHDLRAPLRAINGFSEMLSEDYKDKLDNEGQRIIDIICRNATKMGKLIDDLLAFSRLGRKKMVFTQINMRALIDEVLEEINTAYSHKAEIEIYDTIDIEGDSTLIHQLMLNLISNAIKYSSKKKKPKVWIMSKIRNNEIIYTVKDNGAGFDMKYSDKLFGVFQRLHSQEEFEGTGVGLAIVHRVISRHKGKIWASSELGKGSEFSFSLPIK